MNGHGKMTYGEQYPDVAGYVVAGYVYEGDHRNGKAHGHGIWYYPGGYPDGPKAYVGNSENDKYHGQGTSYSRDGTIEHEGLWQNNEPIDGPPPDGQDDS